MKRYTVKQLAELANVTNRTLHYYDQIGLLLPASYGDNGYRYYDENAVFRLQQILFFRELGFSLEQIHAILEGPDFDLLRALENHKLALQGKTERINRLIDTVDKTIFVGLTGRTNQFAVEQLQTFLVPFGYSVHGIPVNGCLHMKSAVTQVARDILLINPAWVDESNFPGKEFVEVDPSEPYAANALMVGEALLYQPAYPRTLARLETADIHPILVDQSELAKAEGALTCCLLIFRV